MARTLPGTDNLFVTPRQLSFLFLFLFAGILFAQDFSAEAARRFSGSRQIRLHNLAVKLQSAQLWDNGETVTWNCIVDGPLPGCRRPEPPPHPRMFSIW